MGSEMCIRDTLYVVAPGDDISFSFVGEKGFAEYNKRYSGSPSAKEFLEDLVRQKSQPAGGKKGGRWFNPGLPDGKWRLEVPNTGTKLKSMPLDFLGRNATWSVDFDDSMMQGSREPDAEYMDNKGNTRKGKLNSMRFMYLKDFVDLGVLTLSLIHI